MTNHQLEASSQNIRWAAHLLDAMVAPECSTLTSCDVPDLPEPENYWGSFFLNNIFSEKPDHPRPLVVVFLRRYAQAVREYRIARGYIADYLAALAQTNNVSGLYLRSLSHFEQAISNLYLALMAHKPIAQMLAPGTQPPFEPNDDSPADRLRKLYNATKHFDEDILEGRLPSVTTPIWIVRDGLKCLDRRRNPKTKHIELAFSDLVLIFTGLGTDAKFLSEDVYELARQRKASKDSQ